MASFNYLSSFKSYLRLDHELADNLIRELHGHLDDSCRELQESGLSEEEATETAAQFLGSPRLIARQIYEVYSQGNWRQAFFAALPHFLVALLFAMHWWQSTIWLPAILVAVIGTVIYGWHHGKPTWLFPWLGYLLMPVIIVGVLLVYLPGGWTWFVALTYVPVALLILIWAIRQTLKRDWMFVSLMLLPVPIVLGWVLTLSIGNRFLGYERIYEAAPWIALSFAVLALTVTTFIRTRQRWIKAGTLLAPEILILSAVAVASKSVINFWVWLLLILLTLFLLLGPALLERKVRGKLLENH